MSSVELYITDKSGERFFRTVCSERYSLAERNNLKRYLLAAAKNPSLYKFLDITNARIEIITDKEIVCEMFSSSTLM